MGNLIGVLILGGSIGGLFYFAAHDSLLWVVCFFGIFLGIALAIFGGGGGSYRGSSMG